MIEEKKDNSIMLPDEVITSKIYLIRGEKVMLDRDLAELFEIKSIRLREQVKRNAEKFPVHFMFHSLQMKRSKLWYRKMRYLPDNTSAAHFHMFLPNTEYCN